MLDAELKKLAKRADSKLNLAAARLSDEFYYQSLPLCVLDAVFSINARYEGVRRVVNRYCKRFGLNRVRSSADLPAVHDQESISSFCGRMEDYGSEEMAVSILENRCRTSTRNGILKATAAHRFAMVLKNHGIEAFQDISTAMAKNGLETDIKNIPGQRSGIALGYFWMLAGSDESIKPDRMVLQFLSDALDRTVTPKEAHPLVSGAVKLLRSSFPSLTPRLLDHTIWDFQRQQSSTKSECGAC